MRGYFHFLSVSVLLMFSLRTASAEVPFSTNDLSILFPLDSNKSNVPRFVIHPGDSGWRILSAENFLEVMGAAVGQGTHVTDELKDPRNWYLIGMRYSPCTLFHGAYPKCKEQLRFVFQSLNAERGLGGFDDYAMHVVFNFNDRSSPERSKLLDSFRGVKNLYPKLNIDKALSVNPALASAEGPQYFKALQTEVIEKYINNRNPSLITFAGLGGTGSNDDHWIFLTGEVNPGGRWSIAPLNVGAPLLSEHLKVTEDFDFEVNVVASPNQFSLFNRKTPSESENSLLLKILDQNQTNDHNVSCVSCHVADARMFPVLFMDDQKSEKANFLNDMLNVFSSKSRVSELLVDNKIHVGKIGFEAPAVRIFGYLDDRPLVSQRVVMDSALAVEQANSLTGLLTKPQCKSLSERKALLKCLYMTGPSATLADCMNRCCLP